LQELLINEPFRSLQSIIVYCTRRDEAARLASFLRTTLQYQQDEDESVTMIEIMVIFYEYALLLF